MSDKKILLLLYPDCISFEAMLAIEILGEKHHVDVITSNDKCHKDASGLQIQPQVAFDSVAIDDYVALIIPGGNPDVIIGDIRVRQLIQEVYNAGLLVAGICAGVVVLADSGILKGHEITHNYTEKYAPQKVYVTKTPCVLRARMLLLHYLMGMLILQPR